MPVETKGFVNNNEPLVTKKAQLKFVKSYREGLQMENYFENESGEAC